MESILKIGSGQTAIMGGLMQDSVDNLKDAIPGLSKLPVVGGAFAYRNETSTKSELVIFLRPIVIKDAGMNGDFKAYRDFLPYNKFLNGVPNPLLESAKVGAAQP